MASLPIVIFQFALPHQDGLSRTRMNAGAFGFLILSHAFDARTCTAR
jgi:hypothetical protein